MRNLGVCAFEVRGESAESAESAELVTWDVVDLMPVGRKTALPIDGLSTALYRRLDAAWAAWTATGREHIDWVLIENQPTNGRMKTLQNLIYGYFQIQKHYHQNVGGVVLVSARGKLEAACHAHAIVRPQGAAPYASNKKAGVALAQAYVAEDAASKARLASFKKKDDMCDALLQGIAWWGKRQLAKAGTGKGKGKGTSVAIAKATIAKATMGIVRCVSTEATNFAVPI